VLALLALACFPVLAQAGEGSGTVQYHSGPANAEGNAPSADENFATPSKSQKGNGGAEAPSNTSSTGPVGGYSEEAPSESENAGAATGGNGDSGQGKPDHSANPPAKAGVQDGAPLNGPTSSDSGGSSPLVPILIVIAVLAAISIAVVTIRQRRQRDGSGPSLSTKAG
jgi:cobalamin biosynthesis Mg chelatase CobN